LACSFTPRPLRNGGDTGLALRVSVVMRDAPGASAATRAPVWAAARELGYRPDVRARSLAGRKSKLIGVMFGLGVGSFHFDLLEGLCAAGEHGHSPVLSALTWGA
jgi:DNA-binding LacI/PurR family transcriptional regulator